VMVMVNVLNVQVMVNVLNVQYVLTCNIQHAPLCMLTQMDGMSGTVNLSNMQHGR